MSSKKIKDNFEETENTTQQFTGCSKSSFKRKIHKHLNQETKNSNTKFQGTRMNET